MELELDQMQAGLHLIMGGLDLVLVLVIEVVLIKEMTVDFG